MRKSFEKYLRENSTLNHKNSKNQGGGVKLYKLKYYVIGFIVGLFFVGSLSYASGNRGSIGDLFDFIKKDRITTENGRPIKGLGEYRLNGENIKDKTITEYELRDNSVITDKVGNYQITKIKLAPNSVDSTKIEDNSINSDKIENKSIKTEDVEKDFISPNSKKLNKLGIVNYIKDYILIPGIPTDVAVKNYIKKPNNINAGKLNGKTFYDIKNYVDNKTQTMQFGLVAKANNCAWTSCMHTDLGGAKCPLNKFAIQVSNCDANGWKYSIKCCSIGLE